MHPKHRAFLIGNNPYLIYSLQLMFNQIWLHRVPTAKNHDYRQKVHGVPNRCTNPPLSPHKESSESEESATCCRTRALIQSIVFYYCTCRLDFVLLAAICRNPCVPSDQNPPVCMFILELITSLDRSFALIFFISIRSCRWGRFNRGIQSRVE